MLVGAPTDAMWAKACAALEAPELLDDPRFRTNAERCAHRDVLRQEIEARLASGTVAEWTARLEAAGCATAPINTLDVVLSDEQVLANDMVVESPTADGGSRRLLGLPFKLTETPGAAGAAPPSPGQHNRDVLGGQLGLSDDEIAALKAEGAI